MKGWQGSEVRGQESGVRGQGSPIPIALLSFANRAGGISRACGKAKDGRSARIGDEESAIRICEPWLRQRDENTRPSDNLFQDGTDLGVGCWILRSLLD